jgi:hypothetical protein
MDFAADEFQPVVLLNDGETYTALTGCKLIVLNQDEAERPTMGMERRAKRWRVSDEYTLALRAPDGVSCRSTPCLLAPIAP